MPVATPYDYGDGKMHNKSYLDKPIIHNGSTGLQGGTTGEYYHLTADEAQKVDWLHTPADGEITLTPKASSSSTAEGTIFYCSDDNSVYVGVE